MKTISINKNVNLTFIDMSKLKTTAVGVYVHRPLCKEYASENALLPFVLKSGCSLCPSRDKIADYLDNLYGATFGATVMKRGEDHIIYFDAETISDKYAPEGEKLLAELLRLVMSVVFDPVVKDGSFDETIVEQEKINAKDRIDAFVNDKRQYASSRCQQETARGTNFEILSYGSKEGIDEISAESLYEYYRKIISSSVIDIYICGSGDCDEAADVIREYTDKFDFTPSSIPVTDIIERNDEKLHEVTEKMDVAQGKLAIGFLTNIKPTDDDYIPLVVFNSVFGAGAHSKLFNNVREKLSLAYYASSQVEKFKGMLVVNAGIEFCNFKKAYDETLVQLEEIRKGNITEHEFESSVNAVLNTCNSYFDDQRWLVTYYVSERIAGTNLPLEKFIEKIKAVTVEDVIMVSKKLKLDTVYFLAGKEEA